ncbi:MAG TPA: glycosyltransferase [Ktedonobacterales bacterium]
MRVLFATPYVPSLTKPRPRRFIEHLARAHDIHLVAVHPGALEDIQDHPDFVALRRMCASVTLLPLARLRRYVNVMRGIPSRLPARVAYYNVATIREALLRTAERHAVEAVHVDRLRLAPAAISLDLPKIVDATDCLSDYHRQCMRYVHPALKPAYYVEYLKTRRYEHSAGAAYDRCLVTTVYDRNHYLGSAYDERLTVLPNLLEDRLFTYPAESLGHLPATVVFSGYFSYLPNIDAARYLLRTIWPLIVRQVPEVRLILAGAAPHPDTRRLAERAGAKVTGYVPDLAAVVASATVVVSPTRIAVGFPNKVAEALALGKPVVSTSAGCRGLGDCTGALVTADGARAFARAVVHLLRDAEARAALGAAGRAFMSTHFHPTLVGARLDAIYAEMSRQVPASSAITAYGAGLRA